ncbi:FtsQ-type POTRA domain-containing protein [Streptomyces sp. HNM0663]|uniref:Cell division protein FtsQ n=1 Tax=Streptomyces chengmaiensis TaxID=3040919 RepID=A0ABT6HNK3_9ACTN|nr:FtsQ-type POTRA domain-containing protein [Streptomyces chengmaiensis]MDH2389905.1 FtsQ-type POTRA domain-containing protein [Streptomyces chengmaiensis]
MAGRTAAAQRGERARSDGPSDSGSGPAVRPPRPRHPAGRLPGPRTLLIALAALALTAGAVWLLYGSEWLRVERVRTTGAQVLTPGEVRAAAEVPMGAPLVSVDADAVEARLRKRLPRIHSVEVVRSWPSTVVLEVRERRPVLVLEKSDAFVEVDAEGVRFATVARAPRGVPLLELDADSSPSLRRFGVERLVTEAVRVRGELPADVVEATRTIVVRSYDHISVELADGRTVAWGSGEQGPAKARALTALMKAQPRARHFDVSAPTAPAASGS